MQTSMQKFINWLKSHRRITIATGLIVILIFIFFGYKSSTELIVKEAWFGGKLSCIEGQGIYFRGPAFTFTYNLTRDFYFNSDTTRVAGKEWEGDDSDEDDIGVTLSRNADAGISGYLKYQLPSNCDQLIVLHQEQHSDDGVKHNLVRNAVKSAVKKTAPLFTAEEAKVTRVAEFRRMAEDQLMEGEYLTTTESITEQITDDEKDTLGNVIKKGESQQYWITKLKLDKDGNRIITKKSTFKEYGLSIKQFDIQNVSLDQKAQDQLNKIKDREMQRVTNATEAETAKQKAITEKAKGEANVAAEQAAQLVIKIKEVTQASKDSAVALIQAQKKFEVAKKDAEAAEQEALAIERRSKAQAEANRRLVSAGISPQEKLKMMNDMRVEIAKAIASSAQKYVPTIMNVGGGAGSGNAAMDAMGARMYLDMLDKISKLE